MAVVMQMVIRLLLMTAVISLMVLCRLPTGHSSSGKNSCRQGVLLVQAGSLAVQQQQQPQLLPGVPSQKQRARDSRLLRRWLACRQHNGNRLLAGPTNSMNHSSSLSQAGHMQQHM